MTSEIELQSGQIRFIGRDVPSDDVINSCVHCGLCLSSCPTYRETGLEMFSPRGRIYLVKAVSEGRIGMESEVFQQQMSACLDCRACEAVCPSGVEYGQLLETSRTQIQNAREDGRLKEHPMYVRLIRGGVFGILFRNLAMFRLFSRLMWLYQRTGLQWLARNLGILKLMKMEDTEALLPKISNQFVVPKGQVYEASTPQRYRVALATGCIMSTAFAEVHQATIRVLQKNGCQVQLPVNQGCCGALHIHGGDMDGGRELARRNIAAFEAMNVDAIIINAAGCGSTLKEYGHLLHDEPEWAERAKAFSAKIKDVTEFLGSIELNTKDLKPLNVNVTYQEPCHLAHAQRISQQPRKLLKAIPGLKLTEMNESSLCCGSAGVYNMTQPEMAERLGNRKIENTLATGADIVITANPGCHIQLSGGLAKRQSDMAVNHIIELLDRSYNG
jgi:glycolate oxidase iron-sulfur subunit